MKPLMVLGCTSDAGKSWLVTALCRWFARQGVGVAPFKAQNMSNNARVVAGGEIGVAQWLQAKAARIEPDVRMNPVLLKPEADTRSQVIVRGVADRALTDTSWDERHEALWTPMVEAFEELSAENDLVVIEGAGSPAEINLRDQVNNRVIDRADAIGLLVSDIDRGGSFAHLYGTWALVPDSTRRRLSGFVLNRFRGDPGLLAPGPAMLTDMTAMTCAGVIPMVDHELPREEGGAVSSAPVGAPTVVIPRLPYGSNLDEFHLLGTVASIEWATDAAPFERLDVARDLIVLPGSKHVGADLQWLRSRGLDRSVVDAAERGVRIVGVCGGAMMLGRRIADPDGIEGGRSCDHAGLGLLDLDTAMVGSKTTEPVEVEVFGQRFSGYEIRHGQLSADARFLTRGSITATTVHGLFEHPDFVERVVGVRPEPVLESTFERLADVVAEHMDTEWLWRTVEARGAD